MLYQLSVHFCTVAVMQALALCVYIVCVCVCVCACVRACVCIQSLALLASSIRIFAFKFFSLYYKAVPWLQRLTPPTLPPPLTLLSLHHHHLVELLQLLLKVLLPDKYQHTHTLTHLVRAFQWRVAAMIPLCFHICMSPLYRNYKGTGANC